MYTIKSAAKKLGVSRCRVNQLIASRKLSATLRTLPGCAVRFWEIDDVSVHEYVSPPRGRPCITRECRDIYVLRGATTYAVVSATRSFSRLTAEKTCKTAQEAAKAAVLLATKMGWNYV